MKPLAAWGIILLLAIVTAASLLLPPIGVALLAIASLALMRSGRVGFGVFAATTLAINVALLGFLIEGATTFSLGPVSFSTLGMSRGLIGGARVIAVLGANLAILSRISIEVILDGLRLPASTTAFLAAVLIAAHDLGRDAHRLVIARRLDGAWPKSVVRRISAGSTLLAPLLVLSVRRATIRRQALRLAGHDTHPNFAPLVAITALAVASRMAFIALPNLKPTYAIVFLGGLLFGPSVGALSGLLSMAFTDVLLTGLAIAPFANAPAMALVGASGGLLRGWTNAPRLAITAAAAALGFLGTAVFSVASDILTWLVVAEFRTTPGALQILVLFGLAFNVVPAFANAILFAVSVGPVARAARAAGIIEPAMTHLGRDGPREAQA